MTFPPEGVDRLDQDLFLAINSGLHRLHEEFVDVVLRLANETGNAVMLGPITVLALLLAPRGRFGLARMVGLYAALGLVAWWARLLKQAVSRPRPHITLADAFARGEAFSAWGEVERIHGFPSGHAATAAAIAVVLGSWTAAWPEAWRRRTAVSMLVLGTLLVGLARVYAGSHYPLDVLGGFLLGGVAGLVGVGITRLLSPRPAPGGLR